MFSLHTGNAPCQLGNWKSSGSGGSKANEQGEFVMFSSVDEAKELELWKSTLSQIDYFNMI